MAKKSYVHTTRIRPQPKQEPLCARVASPLTGFHQLLDGDPEGLVSAKTGDSGRTPGTSLNQDCGVLRHVSDSLVKGFVSGLCFSFQVSTGPRAALDDSDFWKCANFTLQGEVEVKVRLQTASRLAELSFEIPLR